LLNQEFMQALLLNFRHQGKKNASWQLLPGRPFDGREQVLGSGQSD
jgi:hypothetical protein